jgi:hypothetical protein
LIKQIYKTRNIYITAVADDIKAASDGLRFKSEFTANVGKNWRCICSIPTKKVRNNDPIVTNQIVRVGGIRLLMYDLNDELLLFGTKKKFTSIK